MSVTIFQGEDKILDLDLFQNDTGNPLLVGTIAIPFVSQIFARLYGPSTNQSCGYTPFGPYNPYAPFYPNPNSTQILGTYTLISGSIVLDALVPNRIHIVIPAAQSQFFPVIHFGAEIKIETIIAGLYTMASQIVARPIDIGDVRRSQTLDLH